jgi:PIN domain nuclease of toxin-antitoxin system
VRLLLDSHTLIWAVDNPSQLGQSAVAALQSPTNQLLISAGTIWELGIKTGIGKLVLSQSYRQWMSQAIIDLDLEILPLSVEYAAVQATLPMHHKDPFDRLLVAQAQIEKIPLVSCDVILDRYGISRLWQ